MNFPLEHLSLQLEQAISASALSVSTEHQQKLIEFLRLLNHWNKAYNLTSVREPEKMLYVHILDSIVVSPFLLKQRFIDVGTGPGLPGIPLAILNPDKEFVLLDSLGKRIRFIKQVAYELSLTNIQAVQSRVEEFHPEARFDGVLSRAFASVSDMLNGCHHLVDTDGEFLALKGQYPDTEIAEMPSGFQLAASHSIDVPGLNAERHLITFKKLNMEH